jgi:hypothetical protein
VAHRSVGHAPLGGSGRRTEGTEGTRPGGTFHEPEATVRTGRDPGGAGVVPGGVVAGYGTCLCHTEEAAAVHIPRFRSGPTTKWVGSQKPNWVSAGKSVTLPVGMVRRRRRSPSRTTDEIWVAGRS